RPHPDPVHLRRRPGAQDAGLLRERRQAARPAARARLRVRRAPLQGAEPVPRRDAEERALRKGDGRCAQRRPAAPPAALDAGEGRRALPPGPGDPVVFLQVVRQYVVRALKYSTRSIERTVTTRASPSCNTRIGTSTPAAPRAQ